MAARPVVVAVECYSGYSVNERPTAFIRAGRKYPIVRILRQWRSPEGLGFHVETLDGARYELTHNESRDEWRLRFRRTKRTPIDSAASQVTKSSESKGEQ